MKKHLLVILMLFFTASIFAQNDGKSSQPVTIKFKPVRGDYLRITFREFQKEAILRDNGQTLSTIAQTPVEESEIAKLMGMDWRIGATDAAGNVTITVSYAFIRVEQIQRLVRFDTGEVVTPGYVITFDTRESIRASNPGIEEVEKMPPASRPPAFAKTIAYLEASRDILINGAMGRTFTIVLSPHAKLISVTGIDLLMDQYRSAIAKIPAEPDVRARQDRMIESFFGEDTIQSTLTHGILLTLPAQPVKPGDRWADTYRMNSSFAGYVPINCSYLLNSINGNNAEITVTLEGSYPKTKDKLVIDAGVSYKIEAALDLSTGMYSERKMTGKDIGSIQYPEQPAGTPNKNRFRSSFIGSASVSRLAVGDVKEENSSNFEGGQGAFRIQLGKNWTTPDSGSKIGYDMHLNSYLRSPDQTGLTTLVYPFSAAEMSKEPLAQRADRLLAENKVPDSKSAKTDITSTKMFQTGDISWSRIRYVQTWKDGTITTRWSQTGYGQGEQYSFEVISDGIASSEIDAEITRILDSIKIIPPKERRK